MSFITNFRAIIEGDASLNSMITGGIRFGHLQEDFDISKTWIAWDMKISEQVNCMKGNNAYEVYEIPITATATDTIILNNICERVRDYLNNITTSNFINIRFVSETKITTLSRQVNVYQNSMSFEAIYI
jgi:hypothetical protein